MKKILLSTTVASAIALSAQAADTTAIVTHTELGYIQTEGNTQTKTFNLDANAKKAWDKHAAALKVEGQYGSVGDTNGDDVEVKNKYIIEANYDYKFSKALAFNYLAGYKSDRYAGFAYQAYTGPGLKYQAVKNEKHDLALDGSILYSSDRTYQAPRDTNNYSGYRAQLIYGWQMLENLKFTQEASYRSSFEDGENFFVYSKTAFAAKISDIFSAGVSYKVDYVNQPLAAKTTDSTLTFNLIMDY
jgi:putative salt-induced outer membrane protein